MQGLNLGTPARRFAVTLLPIAAISVVLMLEATGQESVSINVRWTPETTVAERSTLEQRFGLHDGRHTEGGTWQYAVADHSRRNISALVSDAHVQDTHNVDRLLARPVYVPWDIRQFLTFGFCLGAAAAISTAVLRPAIVLARFWVVLIGLWAAVAVTPVVSSRAQALLSIALAVSLVTSVRLQLVRRAPGSLLAVTRRSGSAVTDGLKLIWYGRGLAGEAVFARQQRLILIFVGMTSAATLVLTAAEQVYDANHYVLTVATSLLAGDHPYRDFFEPGTPLAGYLAAAVQIVSGHRLIGEFVKQWVFIVAAVTLAVYLGLRLTHSIVGTVLTLPVTLLLLIETPIYHYSKLFFFPLIVLLGWRYIEIPHPRRAITMAIITSLGFLYRHDYGVYLGFASIMACALALLAQPAARSWRALATNVAAYALALLVILGPWAAVVQANEGLVDFTRSRVDQFQGSSQWVYGSLLHVNPFRSLAPEGPVRTRGESTQRPLGRVQSILPERELAAVWLQQVALLVPVALLLSAAATIWRYRRNIQAMPTRVWLLGYAALFTALVNSAVLRQPTYVLAVAPLIAALSAEFLASRRQVARFCALVALALSVIATFGVVKTSPLVLSPRGVAEDTPGTLARLSAFPPEYPWVWLRYLRDCTVSGDRLLVTGVSPLHVSYYAQRPIAGGHVNWRRGWRSDPRREEQSLELLKRQSVPFAVSTHDPVMADLRPYPNIRKYLSAHYAPVAGSNGTVLIDTRRQPRSWYGPMRLPCFS